LRLRSRDEQKVGGADPKKSVVRTRRRCDRIESAVGHRGAHTPPGLCWTRSTPWWCTSRRSRCGRERVKPPSRAYRVWSRGLEDSKTRRLKDSKTRRLEEGDLGLSGAGPSDLREVGLQNNDLYSLVILRKHNICACASKKLLNSTPNPAQPIRGNSGRAAVCCESNSAEVFAWDVFPKYDSGLRNRGGAMTSYSQTPQQQTASQTPSQAPTAESGGVAGRQNQMGTATWRLRPVRPAQGRASPAGFPIWATCLARMRRPLRRSPSGSRPSSSAPPGRRRSTSTPAQAVSSTAP
jgi:hypothetical protein